jgi:hypothetical protein
VPLLIAYAEHDTDEFRRHSEEFAGALLRAGRLSVLLRVAAVSHFEIIELLGRSGTALFRSVVFCSRTRHRVDPRDTRESRIHINLLIREATSKQSIRPDTTESTDRRPPLFP